MSSKIRMLLVVASLIQEVWFFQYFAVNRDSGTNPNVFLICQNVCDSNGLEDRAIIGSGTTHKKGGSFSRILQRIETLAHITCCSLGSNYSKTVELFSPKLNVYKS